MTLKFHKDEIWFIRLVIFMPFPRSKNGDTLPIFEKHSD